MTVKVAVNQNHYGDPKNGCETDEQAVQVQGLSGDFCSPKCTGILKTKCPTDVPSGATAKPQCALKTTAGAKYCALICSPSTDEASLRAGDAQCGTGSCQAISGVGLCTYKAAKKAIEAPMTVEVAVNQNHYGDPKNGCETDEQAVQVQGLSGDFCSPKCTGILKTKCPTDVPSGATAKPQCALKTTAGNKYCTLICSPSTDEESL